ncbi:hypothetical protein LINGRAHAP2_LOCUS10349 [Linum grandiflorum]
MQGFRDAIEDCNLIDMSMIATLLPGKLYGTPCCIKERLDHCLSMKIGWRGMVAPSYTTLLQPPQITSHCFSLHRAVLPASHNAGFDSKWHG